MTPAERQREAQIQYIIDALTDEDDPFAIHDHDAIYQQAVAIVEGQGPRPVLRHEVDVPHRDVRRYGVRGVG